MKKTCKVLILCVFLFIVFVSCTSATTIRVEPVKAQKTFALEHDLLELCGRDPEFSYTKYLEHRLASDWENLAEWEEYLKESKCFYADMRYSQKEINSVQEAIAVFSDLKQTMNVPSNWVIYRISYDRECDVWKIVAGPEGEEPWKNPDVINDGTWVYFFTGNGQPLFSEWG